LWKKRPCSMLSQVEFRVVVRACLVVREDAVRYDSAAFAFPQPNQQNPRAAIGLVGVKTVLKCLLVLVATYIALAVLSVGFEVTIGVVGVLLFIAVGVMALIVMSDRRNKTN
jgi:hypothetical protein